MSGLQRARRLFTIQRVLARYALDEFLAQAPGAGVLRVLFYFSPSRWFNPHGRNLPRGERIRCALEELGPVFVKFGQIVSTRRDLLPDDIADELARLQDQVPAFSTPVACRIVETALNGRIDTLFAEFSQTPLASASVAQVHSAQLHDGQAVVVKILRPDIEPIIDRDVALMYAFAGLAERYWSQGPRLRPREIVSEFEKTIYAELDLVREAANAAQLRRNFKDTSILYVPEIHWPYTRKNVLVMERVNGLRISDVTHLQDLKVDRQLLAERGVEIFFTQVFRDNFFHADMHPGNIFVDSAKPHDPRYIAVDFGIIGTLTTDDQHYLAENLLAFFTRDYRRVAQLHIDSAWVAADTRIEDFASAIRTVCEPIFAKPLAEISFGQVLLRLFQTAQRFDMPVQPQLVLLQKTLINIEGLGRQLYPQLDLWQTAKPFLERWVSQQKGPTALLGQLSKQAPEWANTLPQLPLLLHGALKQLSTYEQQRNNQTQQLDHLRLQLERNNRRSVCTAVGAALLIAGAVIYGLDGYQPVLVAGAPVIAWVMGGFGVLMLSCALR